MARCEKCLHYQVCAWCVDADSCSFFKTADVVPKSEVEKLEYTLLGVMHSVDKWLEGAELEQNEVSRAIIMREKTLKIVENLTNEVESLKKSLKNTLPSYCRPFNEEELIELGKTYGRQEVAREIFEEIERLMLDGAIGGKYPAKVINPDKYDELKKKYTEGKNG